MELAYAPTTTALSAATRLLLVEDDASIRLALSDMLEDEGFAVTTAVNGREALEELRQSTAPDVIVLDLMMPVMDGWEFRVEQRSDPMLAGIPLLAMSADLSAKARAIAADGYVRKPIDFPEMLHKLREVVGRAAKQRLAAADRMAALGTLASGIAHEINNPLTYVIANLQTLSARSRGRADRPRVSSRTSSPTRSKAPSGSASWSSRCRWCRPDSTGKRSRPSRCARRCKRRMALTENQIKHRAQR